MRIHLELTVDPPQFSRPRQPRTLVALAAMALALLLPGVALANHLFADVPTNHTFHTNISNIAGAGVTAGCGGNTNYCPDEPVTRGQMAAFLNRGLGRVAEADLNTPVTGKSITQVGSVTITPGTSSGAVPGAKQFVHAQFTGSIVFSSITACPCRVWIHMVGAGLDLDALTVGIDVDRVNWYYPISAGGVIAVTGSDPVTISLRTEIGFGGGPGSAYTVYGNLVAETIPFGSTGTSAP